VRTLLLAVSAVLATVAVSDTVLDGSAFARSNDVCLRSNRIWSTNVVNDRTIIVRDRQNNPFVVELSGGCTGLSSTLGGVNFRTRTNLGCLSRGDRVDFRHRALGRNTCFVRDVHTDLATVASARRPSVRANVTR
jgi:hypothetical protein